MIHRTIIYTTVFLVSTLTTKAQHESTKSSLKVAEVEAQWAPGENEFMVSTNGLANVKIAKHLEMNIPWFTEYNFNTRFTDFSLAVDPKLWEFVHASVSFENDLFGEHPDKYHFQTGTKLYLQDIIKNEQKKGWLSQPFAILSTGVNYSLAGTASHRLAKPEFTFNILSTPLWITKDIGFVFQSTGRIRESHDFFIFQVGIEHHKTHSIFMLGTGQVYEGNVEYFVGLQLNVLEAFGKKNH